MSRRVTRAMSAAQDASTLDCVLALDKTIQDALPAIRHEMETSHLVVRGVETRLDAHLSEINKHLLSVIERLQTEIQKRDAETKAILKENQSLVKHVMDLVKPHTLPFWNAVVYDGRRESKPVSVSLYSKSAPITTILIQRREGIDFHGWNGGHVLITPYADETTRALPFFAYKVEWNKVQGIILCACMLEQLI